MPFGFGGGIGGSRGRQQGLGVGQQMSRNMSMSGKPPMGAGGGGGMFGPSNMPNMMSRVGGAMSQLGSPQSPMQGPSNTGYAGGGMGAPSTDLMSRFGSMVPGGGFTGGGMQNRFMQQGIQPNPMEQGPAMQSGAGMFGPSGGNMGGMFGGGMRKPFGGGGY